MLARDCDRPWRHLRSDAGGPLYGADEFEQGTTEKTTEKILNIISENPNITTEELAIRCGLTPDEMSFDSSGLNVPPVALSNVPGISESNVPPIAETNVPGVSL